MNAPADRSGTAWPAWSAVLAGTAATAVSGLLGSLGWFAVGFGAGSNCTDDFSCVSTSCAPCATEDAWVIAGGIGQWALVGASVTLLVLGRRHPARRPVATIGACALIAVALGWFAISMVMAEHSF
jgi:hypothetical protein